MYFWKVDNLVDDFKAKNVSQKEQFKYTLLFSVLVVLFESPLFYIDTRYNYYDSLDTVISIVITIWGVYYCYKRNSRGDDIDFLPRFICLGLPVAMRVLVYFLPIIILLGFLEGMLNIGFTVSESGTELTETTLLELTLFLIFELAYYIYLSKVITRVSSNNV